MRNKIIARIDFYTASIMMSIVCELIKKQAKMQQGYISSIKLHDMSKTANGLQKEINQMQIISDEDEIIFLTPNDF